MFAPGQKHVLFFGHTGSGTTELRHYADKLRDPDKLFPVEVDITTELDRNNLQYADTLMAMARALLAQIEYYKKLSRDWAARGARALVQ